MASYRFLLIYVLFVEGRRIITPYCENDSGFTLTAKHVNDPVVARSMDEGAGVVFVRSTRCIVLDRGRSALN